MSSTEGSWPYELYFKETRENDADVNVSDTSPTCSSNDISTDDGLEEPTGAHDQQTALLTTTKASSTDGKEVVQVIPKCGSAVLNALPTSTERNASIFKEDTVENLCPNIETNYTDTNITMNETVSPLTNCKPDSDHAYVNTCDVTSFTVDNEKRFRLKSDSDNRMSHGYISMDAFPKRQCQAYGNEVDRKDRDKEISVEAGENTNKDNEPAEVEEDYTVIAEALFCNGHQGELEDNKPVNYRKTLASQSIKQDVEEDYTVIAEALVCNVHQEELEDNKPVNYRKTLRVQSIKRRQRRKDRRCLDYSALAATITKEV